MSVLTALIGIVLGAGGIGGNDAGNWPIILPSPGFVETLEEKAGLLARAQLEKFNAIEQTYKNTVEFHGHTQHPFNPEGGIYIKSYRVFTAYWVKDIYRSDSFLYPITYEIAYRCTFLTTTDLHHSDFPDSRELAEKETEYTARWSGTLTRRYACDATGEYKGNLPELTPRQKFFTRAKEEPNMPAPNPFSPAAEEGWITWQEGEEAQSGIERSMELKRTAPRGDPPSSD